jgi:hypothetical protein
VIEDRCQVTPHLDEFVRRLDALTEWISAPCQPFPADAMELGEFTGQVTLLLLSGDRAPADSPPAGEGRRQ